MKRVFLSVHFDCTVLGREFMSILHSILSVITTVY